MIFVSSSCVRNKKIVQSVQQLVAEGYRNIELSGGTTLYKGLLDDLLALKKEFNLNYLVHNYFPPPENAFVLNLASLKKDTFEASFHHCKRAIELAEKLGGNKIAFHAGFFLDIPLSQIGKKIEKVYLSDKKAATKKFHAAFRQLELFAKERNISLYVENNVLSKVNHINFDGENPLMLTNLESYLRTQKEINSKILLDIAHLKVSCKTLGLNFQKELNTIFSLTDYIHVSDNNGEEDSNKGLGNDLFSLMKDLNWANKVVTLEVYESLDALEDSYQKVKLLCNAE